MIADWFHPDWLHALWVVPLLAITLFMSGRWQRRAADRFASATMLNRLAPQPDHTRRFFKEMLLAMGVICLVVAIARPRYGTYLQDITTSGSDVFIVLDVSRSMLADDVKPNRLERAKSDILDLTQRLQGDRVGLVVFAGTPVLKVPLTEDVSYFGSELADIDEESAPRGGSLIGDAILKALNSMETRVDRQQSIVLISDGEDHDSFPKEAAASAAERNVQIIAVGLGDPDDGARIPLRDKSGNLSYLQYNDGEVWSVLREETLRDLAKATGGAYIPARTRVYDLGDIYENHLAGFASNAAETQKKKKLRERFQIFAGLAFFCLVIEQLISAFRSPRKQVVGN